MRQAPAALRPSQRLNHPKFKKKSSKGSGSCRLCIFVIAVIFFVVVILAITQYRANRSITGGFKNQYVDNAITFVMNSEDKLNDSKRPSVSQKTSLYNSDGTKRRRIGYAITMTKDGNFLDGAAILAYSIYEASLKGDDIISLIAFVHPNVTKSRPTLQKLGYHVIVGNF